MISWKYKLVFHKDNIKDYYAIHEIYEDKDNNVVVSDMPIITANSKEEIINDLKLMIFDIESDSSVHVVDHTKTIISKEIIHELQRRKKEAKENPEKLISLEDLREEIDKKLLENYRERCEFYEHSIIEHYNTEENPSEADKKLWNNKVIQSLLSLQNLIDYDQELGLY